MMPVERRERISAGIAERSGISKAMIEGVVRTSYVKVRADGVLARVFDARIHDWEPNLSRCAPSGHRSG